VPARARSSFPEVRDRLGERVEALPPVERAERRLLDGRDAEEPEHARDDAGIEEPLVREPQDVLARDLLADPREVPVVRAPEVEQVRRVERDRDPVVADLREPPRADRALRGRNTRTRLSRRSTIFRTDGCRATVRRSARAHGRA
jgi:hypothetical protein